MFEYCLFKVKLFILIFIQSVAQSPPTFYLLPISSSDELRFDREIIRAFCWESGFPDNVIKVFLENVMRQAQSKNVSFEFIIRNFIRTSCLDFVLNVEKKEISDYIFFREFSARKKWARISCKPSQEGAATYAHM